ncbi:MAG TPA: hypothetical protein VGL81_22310 [Polyangiaceae bacterium]|jgi:hypothetical protein
MPDDKPNAFEDVRKGLGLLFRAAKTTVEKLPTKDLEEVVVTSAREVGRALENVGKTIEREVFGKDKSVGQKDGGASTPEAKDETPKDEEPPKPPEV